MHSPTNASPRHHWSSTHSSGPERIATPYSVADLHRLLHAGFRRRFHYVPKFVPKLQKALQAEALQPFLIILFHTGVSRLWGTPAYKDSIVGIHVDAVAWMLDQGVKVYGLDNQSPDLNVVDLPNHQLLGKREHHHIENLRNLDQIPTRRFTFFGLPLNLRNATASPIRAVALVEGK